MADANTILKDRGGLTLPACLQGQAGRRGAAVALRHKRLGLWHEQSWSDAAAEVGRLAAALAARGFGSGDALLLLSHPRPEALLLSLAAQWLGGMALPLDPGQAPGELTRLLRHVQPRFVFAEGQEQVDLIVAAGLAPELLAYADPRGMAGYRVDGLSGYAALVQAAPVLPAAAIQARPEQAAFVLYRFDAQGQPRCQSLRHGELLELGRRVVAGEQLTEREEALAAPSLAAAGHTRYLLAPWLLAGFRLNFPESLATRDNDRRELGPTLVAGTRAGNQRLEERVLARLPHAGSWRRRLAHWALAGNGGACARVLGYWLVRRPLRDVIGFSRTRAPLILGEALPESSARFFLALGIVVHPWPDPQEWRAAQCADAGRAGADGATVQQR